jgi:DNA-binding NarL/FixJ family response regulator
LAYPDERPRELTSGPSPDSLTPRFTPREREVLVLVGHGLSNRRIGELLAITERTVETHVRHVLRKLRLRSRTQAAVWAVQHGLESPTPDAGPGRESQET